MSANRCIRINDELWDAVRAEAEREGRTVTSIIEASLTRYVSYREKKRAALRAEKRAARAAARAAASDLSPGLMQRWE